MDKQLKFSKAIWSIYNNTEEVESGEDTFDDFLSERPTCNIGIGISYPFKISQYEIAKFNVDLHIPCYPEKVDETYELGYEWVNDKIKGFIAKTVKNK